MGSGWVGLQRKGLFQVRLWELADFGRVVLPGAARPQDIKASDTKTGKCSYSTWLTA